MANGKRRCSLVGFQRQVQVSPIIKELYRDGLVLEQHGARITNTQFFLSGKMDYHQSTQKAHKLPSPNLGDDIISISPKWRFQVIFTLCRFASHHLDSFSGPCIKTQTRLDGKQVYFRGEGVDGRSQLILSMVRKKGVVMLEVMALPSIDTVLGEDICKTRTKIEIKYRRKLREILEKK